MSASRRLTANHWGPGLAEVSDGRLVAVAPHPDDPEPSRLNDNVASSLNGGARVRRPAVRRGYLENGPGAAGGARGREPFVEVSWDEALALTRTALQRVWDGPGAEGIFAGSYGWSSAGRFHHAQTQLKRFLNAYGGAVVSEGNYSYQAALDLMPHIVKGFRDQVKEATRFSTVAREGGLFVAFGGAPLRNAQVTDGGLGRHRVADALRACAAAGVRFVNISPLAGDMDAALDPEWLAPRPGSDTAIMMGLAHTLLAEGLHDQTFLDRYTVGFERLAAYLRGEVDGVAKDADWAAAQSGLDAARIRDLAREMAAQRTMIATAFGLQRADYGEQVLWMTVALAAMLGQIGLPGGGFTIGYAGNGVIGAINRPMRWAHFPQGANPIAETIPVAMVADALLDPGGAYEHNGARRVFPRIRLVWWAGGNPFHHHQDLNRLRRAFQRPETVLVNEINWTATARHADIVLPVAAPAERDDFSGGQQDASLIPSPKLAEPPGEARCEYEIYRALEKRLGRGAPFSEGLSMTAQQERLWEEMRALSAAEGRPLPGWADFLAGDVVDYPDPAPEHVFLADFRADPVAHPLPTPSGRIELFSETIAAFGYDDCPGHPVWLPPRERASAPAEGYPLHLLSGQPETRLHSQFDNGDFSRSRKIEGREPILINRGDAEARGVADGDLVLVFNARGRCLAGARVIDAIRPGVVFLWTGAWYDPDFDDPDHLDRHGNPNVLTHDLRTSRLSQGPAAQSAFVEVQRFDGAPPAVRAFEPPVAPSLGARS